MAEPKEGRITRHMEQYRGLAVQEVFTTVRTIEVAGIPDQPEFSVIGQARAWLDHPENREGYRGQG